MIITMAQVTAHLCSQHWFKIKRNILKILGFASTQTGSLGKRDIFVRPTGQLDTLSFARFRAPSPFFRPRESVANLSWRFVVFLCVLCSVRAAPLKPHGFHKGLAGRRPSPRPSLIPLEGRSLCHVWAGFHFPEET